MTTPAQDLRDVQAAGFTEVQGGPGTEPVLMRVEIAVRLGDGIHVVAGWRSGTDRVELRDGERVVDADVSYRPRGDVAERLDLGLGDHLGFTVVTTARHDGDLQIALAGAGDVRPLRFLDGSDPAVLRSIGESDRTRIGALLTPFSTGWTQLVAGTRSRRARGNEAWSSVDLAVSARQVDTAVVSGWLLFGEHSSAAWIETGGGDVFPLNQATFHQRQDVLDAHGGRRISGPALPGFTIELPGVTVGTALRLRAVVGGEVVDVSEVAVGQLPDDPVTAAEQLFGMAPAGGYRFSQFVRRVAAEMIDSVLVTSRAAWDQYETTVKTFGELPAHPKVSIVVPLYGRFDFVEHQFIEFARDDWLLANAEITYVVDDPGILDQFHTEAFALHPLYRVPFRMVWGGLNRGFAGANNLGATFSSGEHLLFLNSDAIPQGPGWLPELVKALESDDEIGVVAPRLVFADGSIQHTGMTFRYRGDLEIWVNHHPEMGLDPKLDPAGSVPVERAAVTGACMLVRRGDFDAIGSWDTGYLIGDFEDSDFCLKVRDLGKLIYYVPGVQLTHLERQSFKGLGDGQFRQQVVIYNAVRHQNRWEHQLKELSHA